MHLGVALLMNKKFSRLPAPFPLHHSPSFQSRMNNEKKGGERNLFINIKNCRHICMKNKAPLIFSPFFLRLYSILGAVFNLEGTFF